MYRLAAAKRLFFFVSLACICLVVIYQLSLFFQSFQNIFNHKSIYHLDFSLLHATIEKMRAWFAGTGKLWGYDSQFLAGFPMTFTMHSNILIALVAIITGLGTAQVVKLYLVSILLLEPLIIYFSTRNFGFRRDASILVSLVMVVILGASQALFYKSIGLLGGYLVYLLGLYMVSLTYQYAVRGKLNSLIRLCLVATLSLLVHKTIFIFFTCICLPFILYLLIKKQYNSLRNLSLAALVVIILNLFWLVPFLRYLHWADFSYAPFFSESLAILLLDFSILADQYLFSLPFLFSLSWFVSIYFFFKRSSNKKRKIIGSGILLLTAFFLFAPAMNFLRGMHWARYYVCIVIFSSLFFAAALTLLLQRFRHRRSLAVILPLLVTLALFFLPSHLKADLAIFKESYSVPFFKYEQDAKFQEFQKIAAIIREKTTKDDVIYFQHSSESGYLYTHLAGQTGRRFINSNFHYAYVKHNYINRFFYDCLQKGPDPKFSWPERATFKKRCDRFSEVATFFNTDFFMVSKPGSKKILKSRNFTAVASRGSYTLFQKKHGGSNFLKGSGNLDYSLTQVTITNAKSEQGRIILKMHWFEPLKVQGAETIKPYFLDEYPLPFIELVRPESLVRIHL